MGISRDWKSRWFSAKNYKDFFKTDILIRKWLVSRLKKMYIESVEIERSPAIVHIIIKTSRPGLIIGRGGEGVEKLKKEIRAEITKIQKKIFKQELKLTIEEVRSPESYASIVSKMVADDLEKRLPFRRVIKKTVDKVMANKKVKGVKIVLSGRLGGAEMGRREWLKKGEVPLQTLRADIDFSRERAHLSYGDIGIKVWIYKGEIFSGKERAGASIFFRDPAHILQYNFIDNILLRLSRYCK
ncbi:MAG: 30S ribosomal protein S3 [Candidatus Tagabacteria bacterium RIFCSPLOWO2_01_FULL_39_11]|uniref:Small ribosomal subunit protein uS3 n=1 Tax=Candidatus Tagabacteria bacterium RIFCSPLOWO2_01_FULL_39_11 TaxID=1802295 RepID=A0A1G2LPQ8_9BACT|nr:MAG: 30S ribosomal protein S3 [Candidatus Tagabacteria bacterium RIFCSPLOWO2_01_FULL_39_11]